MAYGESIRHQATKAAYQFVRAIVLKLSKAKSGSLFTLLGATGIDSLPKVRVSMPGVDGISRPEQIVKTITGEYNYAMAA